MAEGGEEGVCAGVREDGEPLPLIVRPKDGKNSFEFLRSWVAENKEWIDRKLLEHGGLYKWAELSLPQALLVSRTSQTLTQKVCLRETN